MTLTAANLTFAYRHGRAARHVFENLSATFEPGLVTAVLGPNGSGKSTLLRCLLGLLTPQHGRVTLGTRTVHDLTEPQRARVMAYVPQRPSVALGFTVANIVALGAGAQTPGPLARDAAMRALSTLDLADRADEPFCELSQGQQQRAVLARALAQLDTTRAASPKKPPAPFALLADEPTSAMDPRHAVEAMGILRQQASLGCVVVVVLHDLTAALRSADRVLLLDDQGRPAATGPPAQALTCETLQEVYHIDFVNVTDPESQRIGLVPAVPSSSR
ncbi:MAG: ABC transporter ATP-binding protein [Planctomycetota bacterium]|nr:ABC transporter ATP-binding protein [Planctomycetota bacterium]